MYGAGRVKEQHETIKFLNEEAMLKNPYNLDIELNRPVHDKNSLIPGKSCFF